jgi:hypothetical protein
MTWQGFHDPDCAPRCRKTTLKLALQASLFDRSDPLPQCCSIARRPPKILVVVLASAAKSVVVNPTVSQSLGLNARIPDSDNARLRDEPVSVNAFVVRVMPVGGVNSPAPLVPAEFLASEVLRGDWPTLAKIRVRKRLRLPECKTDYECAQEG